MTIKKAVKKAAVKKAAVRKPKLVAPDLTNAQTKELLKYIGACAAARRWVGRKTLKQAWETCENYSWMYFLLDNMRTTPGWPNGKQIIQMQTKVFRAVGRLERKERRTIETPEFCDLMRSFIQIPYNIGWNDEL